MAKKPLLSIALLASNRIDTVRRCLDSLLPIMEQISSELIILDTSTDPQVPPVLAEYTDNITKFTWVNDFSAARNETVKRAKGEWYLYIDDDEWFTEIEELISFFKSGEYKKYGCANYIQRNFHDPDLVHFSDCWASRMIRMTSETHFESKIHEYLAPVPGECKNLNLIANHTGYIFTTKEDNKKRFDRNSVLLKEMIKEEPEVLRWRVQMAQEYHAMHMWEELNAFCLDNLEFTKNHRDKLDCRDIGTFYGGAVESYFYLKEYHKGLELGKKAIKDKRCSELCHAYIYLRFAATAFEMKNWKLAEKSIESYFLLRKELEKTPAKLANQQGALLINEVVDSVPTKRAYCILIVAGLKQKNTRPLHEYLSLLEWDEKVIYVYEPMIPVFVEGIAELPYEPIFAEALQLLWNNKEAQLKVLKCVNEYSQKDLTAYNHLLFVLSRLTGEHWYLWYAKVLVADMEWEQLKKNQQGSMDGQHTEELCQNTLIETLLGIFRYIRNIFHMPHEIKQIVRKYNFSLEELYLSVSYEQWKNHLRDFIAETEEDHLLSVERELTAIKTREDIRYDYFFARVAEAKVLYHAGVQDYAKKKSCLDEFSKKTLVFLRKYYQPQIFTEALDLLPEYGQAAFYIEQAFALEKSNPTEMLRILKEVVEVYPTFATMIKSFIMAYGIEQHEAKRRQREEMRNLKAQILGEVQKFVAKKQYTEALSIVKQLKQMCPDDLELVALSLELRLAMLG